MIALILKNDSWNKSLLCSPDFDTVLLFFVCSLKYYSSVPQVEEVKIRVLAHHFIFPNQFPCNKILSRWSTTCAFTCVWICHIQTTEQMTWFWATVELVLLFGRNNTIIINVAGFMCLAGNIAASSQSCNIQNCAAQRTLQ